MKKILFLTLVFIALFGCNNTNKSNENKQRIGIKMTKDGGVYTLPCLVNGVKMNFIFDTGASNVCISLTEALFLYKNGYIDDKDLGDETKSMIADGSVTSGMKLKIRTIEIGGVVLKDVDAVVSSSIEAPLLLGQSAIRKLGKIEMDGDSLFIIGNVDLMQELKSMGPSEADLEKVNELCIKGWNAYKNDMPEFAVKCCDEAIEVWGYSWIPYALKGMYKLKIAKDETEEKDALIDFKKAFELNEKRETFYINETDSITYQYLLEKLSWLYCLNYNTQEALTTAQEGLTIYPQSVGLMKSISLAYTIEEKYELAEKWANKIKEIDLARGHFMLGYVYGNQGRITEAAKQFELCLANDPDDTGALNNLAYAYQCLGDHKKSLNYRKEAAKRGSVLSQDWLRKNGYEW